MRLAVVAAAAATAAAIVAPPAGAAPARIVYSSGGSLTAIDADGSHRTTITGGDRAHDPFYGSLEDREPRWTPDGSAIVFQRLLITRDPDGTEEDVRGRVLAMRPDGSGAHRILPRAVSADNTFRGFLPNGQLVIERSLANRTTFYGVDPDGAHRHAITGRRASPFYSNDFAYSPDGRSVLSTQYTLDRHYYYRPVMYVARADGTHQRVLARDAGYGRYSPDGRRIAFMSVRDRNGDTECSSDSCEYAGEIYVMNADGSHPRRLTDNEGADQGPTWSADGRRIAFYSDRNSPGAEDFEIYSIGADGRCLTWLTNGSADSVDPDWSPGPGETDPGACGGAHRPARIDVDLSVLAQESFPVYWFGPRLPGGIVIDYLQHGDGYADLAWGDCSYFEHERCGPGAQITSYGACGQVSNLLLRGGPRAMSLRRGALVVNPTPFYGDFPSVFTGRGVIWFSSGFAYIDPLRRWPDEARPPAGRRLPPAAFPEWFWRKLAEAEDSYERTGDEDASAEELGISRRAVERRVGMARRLRELGVHDRLRHCAKPPGVR